MDLQWNVDVMLAFSGHDVMDLSYSQNMEDYHLWLAFGGQRTGSYIDIGAGHPIADNVSFFSMREDGKALWLNRSPISLIYIHACDRATPESAVLSERVVV